MSHYEYIHKEENAIITQQGQRKRSSLSDFGWTINCKKKIFFCFSSQVILYTDILCCLYLECNVLYIFHANSENVPKIAYLGIYNFQKFPGPPRSLCARDSRYG